MIGTLANNIIPIISSLLVFSVIVLLHEFGHFSVAKLSGVKIHEFAIGMGPKLFSIHGKETEYSIRALPIGGYVKMLGEDEESEDERSFGKKNIFARIAIIAAGPIMNFLTAIAIFAMISMAIGFPSTYIGELIEGYPAQEAGLLPGDKIVEINGQEIEAWNDIIKGVNTGADETYIKVERDGETLNIKLVPVEEDGRLMVGISPEYKKDMGNSLKYGFLRTKEILFSMIEFLGQAITGQSKETVVGPVGIIKVVSDASRTGIMNVMYIMGIISINLGLINLIPFPALDGGRIVLLLVEMIRRKKMDEEREGMFHFIGFVILMIFMVMITWKDIVRMLGN